jgi:hypothetical protein
MRAIKRLKEEDFNHQDTKDAKVIEVGRVYRVRGPTTTTSSSKKWWSTRALQSERHRFLGVLGVLVVKNLPLDTGERPRAV